MQTHAVTAEAMAAIAQGEAMTQQHTSGPWQTQLVDDGFKHDVYWRIGRKLSRPTATIRVYRKHQRTKEEAEANARLIAAAPDLLAALERTNRLFEKALPKFNWGASALDANAIKLLNEVPREVRAAIAKTTSPQGR